jgi:protein-disulfide isomerase
MGGNEKAPVTIVEFGDLLCPHCKKSFDTFSKVVAASNDNVRFVFRHFPLMKTPGHELALMAAMVSEVAAEKDHFWDFLSEMYSVDNGSELTKDDIYKYASQVGVNVDTLDQRLQDENDPIYKTVLRDIKEGGKLGISSTPTLVVSYQNQKPIEGDANTIHDVLSAAPYNQYVKGL